MDKEIKFRAWDSKSQRMYYQGEPDLEDIQSFFHHYNENDELMQFTGLHDKNGKEIYEGDILQRKNSSPFLVKFGDCKMLNNTYTSMFYLDNREFLPEHFISSANLPLIEVEGVAVETDLAMIYEYDLDAFYDRYAWEVIGNIYKNPELLKK